MRENKGGDGDVLLTCFVHARSFVPQCPEELVDYSVVYRVSITRMASTSNLIIVLGKDKKCGILFRFV